jgi:hypothetical protein
VKNAHLRFGTLRFQKNSRDSTLDVRVWLDRLIVDPNDRGGASAAHLVSVIGGHQDIAAVAGAVAEQIPMDARGPGIPALRISLGEGADVFRGTLAVAGRKRPVRHLVAISRDLALTRTGGDPAAGRTVLCSSDPQFVLYRVGVRFGLPVLPAWSDWFWHELERRHAVRPLVGLGCEPVLVTGTKKRFLAWVGRGLRRGDICIPDGTARPEWRLPSGFEPLPGGAGPIPEA